MIVSRTPFRISFFGGGTDYPTWSREHGGAVLATSIDKYCYLTCRYLPPFFEHRFRLVYSKIEACHAVGEITHPAAREVLRYMKMERGVEIHHDGDLPARSGMGSSSAFTVGLLNALYALKGRMPSKHQLAMESIQIEQEMVKETVGSQDQVMAAYGGLNHVVFHPNGEITVRPVALTHDSIRELNAHLMLFYTGIKRTAAHVAKSYVDQIGEKKKQLHTIRDMVDESISILNGGNDLAKFGDLLHEAWQAKRSLSSHVTNSDVDEIYEAARAAGALGGKLTGAGGGGFMLLFAPPSKQEAIRERLNKLLHVPFEFEFNGSQIIFLSHEVDYTDAENARANQSLQAFRELTAPQS
ncbi:MAG: kinase [Verrucomicrobia bacterium]|nr:kinase [Verrucomicrobiota bacterium]